MLKLDDCREGIRRVDWSMGSLEEILAFDWSLTERHEGDWLSKMLTFDWTLDEREKGGKRWRERPVVEVWRSNTET